MLEGFGNLLCKSAKLARIHLYVTDLLLGPLMSCPTNFPGTPRFCRSGSTTYGRVGYPAGDDTTATPDGPNNATGLRPLNPLHYPPGDSAPVPLLERTRP